jgi:hypothetical protein
MFDNKRNRIDTIAKVHENSIRRELSRNGYQLRKSRQRCSTYNQGKYQVVRGDKIVAGKNFELSLERIEAMLFNGALFLYGDVQAYLVKLARRNPWFRRQGGGHKCLIAFYSKHFLRRENDGCTVSGEKVLCKKCGSDKFVRSGIVNNKQRYQCKLCGCSFTVGDFRLRDQRFI